MANEFLDNMSNRNAKVSQHQLLLCSTFLFPPRRWLVSQLDCVNNVNPDDLSMRFPSRLLHFTRL